MIDSIISHGDLNSIPLPKGQRSEDGTEISKPLITGLTPLATSFHLKRSTGNLMNITKDTFIGRVT